ncbi:hypothetical protein [Photobacterium angustum]|uniref:Uncharacterized protein n=1 Tax=Photobacterium angustum TaxID=661 RepID=A0A2S7VXF6_PHOAN|nr:hypothetical protein [Photobacterium angustum]PQJ66518.1 hypothetical protein BTO08_03285 [Photobacterium angustum]
MNDNFRIMILILLCSISFYSGVYSSSTDFKLWGFFVDIGTLLSGFGSIGAVYLGIQVMNVWKKQITHTKLFEQDCSFLVEFKSFHSAMCLFTYSIYDHTDSIHNQASYYINNKIYENGETVRDYIEPLIKELEDIEIDFKESGIYKYNKYFSNYFNSEFIFKYNQESPFNDINKNNLLIEYWKIIYDYQKSFNILIKCSLLNNDFDRIKMHSSFYGKKIYIKEIKELQKELDSKGKEIINHYHKKWLIE